MTEHPISNRRELWDNLLVAIYLLNPIAFFRTLYGLVKLALSSLPRKHGVAMSVAACLLFLASGCVNIYTRFPTTTDARIEECYQSTRTAALFTVAASFPQTLNPYGTDDLVWWNLLSVPCFGLPCAVDTCCEAVVDTVCLPFDLTR